MYSKKMLCYKLCYCLGVGEEALQEDFTQLHELAKESNYFDALKVTRTYRAISRIYFAVARRYDLYTPGKSFTKVAGTLFKPVLEGVDLVPELIYSDAGDVRSFLGKLAEMSHQMLPQLYAELKPAIDYLSFEMLVRLEPLTEMELEKVSYILRHSRVQYNVYFFASELFNFASRDMLKSDATLRKCLAIVTGRESCRSSDTSELAKELGKQDDGYFVSASMLVQNYKNIYLVQKDMPADAQSKVLSVFAEAAVPVNVTADPEGFMKLWDERPDMHESVIVIARLRKDDVLNLLKHCDTLQLTLLIPIVRTLYRKVLSGEIERTSLLSLE